MEITKNMEGAVLHVALAGRLDTLTSNDLGTALEEESGFTDIIFDFAALEYLSSSGLRLLFTYQKKLGGKEHVIVRNANAVVREIFRVTGFARQVTLE
jgi:anti-sigma B factor antagonist